MRDYTRFYLAYAVNGDAGPGVPLNRLASTNKQLILKHSSLVEKCVLNRMRLLLTSDGKEDYSPEELIKLGLCDPVRLFVKNEPHGVKKELSRRWRLISSVSLIDQLCERLMFSEQNRLEITQWKDLPSKPGLGLDDYEDLAAIASAIPEGKVAEADVTGWDWSVQEWELEIEAYMRSRLMQLAANEPLARAIRLRYQAVARSVFVEPSGRLISQKWYGVQLSGCYNTSSTNSRLRVLVAHLVGAKWAMAMGDDCVETFVENAFEKYRLLGHPLKMYRLASSRDFEFCSHRFRGNKCFPVNPDKSLFRLLSKGLEERDLAQFQSFLKDHPDRKLLSALAKLEGNL